MSGFQRLYIEANCFQSHLLLFFFFLFCLCFLVVRRPVEFHAMEFVEFIKTPKVDSVVLHRPFYAPIEGTLCLTGHHLILSSRKTNSEELWVGFTILNQLP